MSEEPRFVLPTMEVIGVFIGFGIALILPTLWRNFRVKIVVVLILVISGLMLVQQPDTLEEEGLRWLPLAPFIIVISSFVMHRLRHTRVGRWTRRLGIGMSLLGIALLVTILALVFVASGLNSIVMLIGVPFILVIGGFALLMKFFGSGSSASPSGSTWAEQDAQRMRAYDDPNSPFYRPRN